MGKTTTMRVMTYLTMSEMAKLGSVCHYFRLVYREVWHHSDFFQSMDLRNFTSVRISIFLEIFEICKILEIDIFSPKSRN